MDTLEVPLKLKINAYFSYILITLKKTVVGGYRHQITITNITVQILIAFIFLKIMSDKTLISVHSSFHCT